MGYKKNLIIIFQSDIIVHLSSLYWRLWKKSGLLMQTW